MKDTTAKLIGYPLGVIAALAVTVPLIILRGVVLSYLWLWFVTPLGVPALSLIHAIGVSFTFALILMGSRRETHKRLVWKRTKDNLFGTLTIWLFGFVTYLLMV